MPRLSSGPGIVLLSLGHPLGAVPAPCGNFAALLFRFLPQEIARATKRGLRPTTGRDFLRLPSQKAPLATWEQGTLACFATGVPSEFRTNQIRRINTMALYENTIRLKGFLGRDAET